MFAGAASADAGRAWRLASGSGALASPACFPSDLTTFGSHARRALATSALRAVWLGSSIRVAVAPSGRRRWLSSSAAIGHDADQLGGPRRFIHPYLRLKA